MTNLSVSAMTRAVSPIDAGQFEVGRVRQVRREVASILDGDAPVAEAVHQQGRHMHRGQHVGDVQVVVDAHQRHRGRAAGALPLEARPVAAESLIRRLARRDRGRHQRGAPAAFHHVEPRRDLLGQPDAGRGVDKYAVEHQRAHPLRIGGGEQQAQ